MCIAEMKLVDAYNSKTFLTKIKQWKVMHNGQHSLTQIKMQIKRNIKKIVLGHSVSTRGHQLKFLILLLFFFL